MNIRAFSFLFVCFSIALSMSTSAEDRKIHMISLKNQIPLTMIPAIRPLLDEGDTITSYGDQLIISTRPTKLREIQAVIDKLDKRMHNLMITVQNNRADTVSDKSESIVGALEEDHIRIDTGEPLRQEDGVTISHEGIGYHVKDKKTRNTGQLEQLIRAVEGTPAFIYTGQSINIPSRDRYGNVYTSEIDARQGFYLIARLLDDDTVLLEISLSNDTFQPDNQKAIVNTERLASTVSGSTGEWISLGNLSVDNAGQTDGLVKKITTENTDLSAILVKVVPID